MGLFRVRLADLLEQADLVEAARIDGLLHHAAQGLVVGADAWREPERGCAEVVGAKGRSCSKAPGRLARSATGFRVFPGFRDAGVEFALEAW